jgi:cytochrome c
MNLKRVLLLAFFSASVFSAYAADYSSLSSSPAPLGAIERSEAKMAGELIERAVDYLKKNGPEKSEAVFNDRKGTFVNNEYYVYMIGLDGIMYASGGASRTFIGLNVTNLQDAAGKAFIREMLDKARSSDSGTIKYVWLNHVANREENKTTLFRKVGKYIVCVGYYIPRSSIEQATALLSKAVELMEKSGERVAFKTFNDPTGGFVLDDEYVFAVGLDDGKYRASGAAPDLTGVDVRDLTDAAGKPLFKEMIEIAKQKGSGEVDYVWRNPATNAVEHKHTLIQRIGNVLLGVGYYTKN